MYRYDSESSRRGLGRQSIKTRFQAISNFQKMSSLDLQMVCLWIFLPEGPTTARNLCFFTLLTPKMSKSKLFALLTPKISKSKLFTLLTLKISKSKLLTLLTPKISKIAARGPTKP